MCWYRNDRLGIWIPEPYYHFKPFSQEERRVINSSMVAALITLYDEENNQGLSKVRLDCGDFMLLKGYEEEELIQDSIYKLKTYSSKRFYID